MVQRNSEGHMQEQIDRLSNQLSNLEKKVDVLVATQPINHQQNRKDIHELRNNQQRYIDALQTGFEKMVKSLDEALTPIRKDIFDLQMWKSKTTGYVLGLSALAALIFKVVEFGLSYAGMK